MKGEVGKDIGLYILEKAASGRLARRGRAKRGRALGLALSLMQPVRQTGLGNLGNQSPSALLYGLYKIDL